MTMAIAISRTTILKDAVSESNGVTKRAHAQDKETFEAFVWTARAGDIKPDIATAAGGGKDFEIEI
jgi:hypothetical protein